MVNDLEKLRKKIRFRGARRGTRESDLLIGGFVVTNLNALDAPQLTLLEALLEQNDQDVLSWINEITPPPPVFQNNVLQMLIEYKKSL